MALDYIIGGLQLISAAVNILGLGAFWISPGLRTTANRFVINLLVANVIGCLALTPALWINGGLKTRFQYENNAIIQKHQHSENVKFDNFLSESESGSEKLSLDDALKPLHHHNNHKHHHKVQRDLQQQQQRHQDELSEFAEAFSKEATVEESIESMVIDRDANGNIHSTLKKQVIDIQNGKSDEVEIVEEIVAEPIVNQPNFETISQMKQQTSEQMEPIMNIFNFNCSRFWGFDLAAALGVLSVVLVVGDTWCAVTDPLRYHSRISYMKSWILIGSVWTVSILFSAISAFQPTWCAYEMENGDITNTTLSSTIFNVFDDSTEAAIIYGLVFSCVFFTFIILIPIVVVCIMYWNIFSEARQSGLRMRRNGSSPLLQSSLNLHNSSINSVAMNEGQRYPSLYDISSPEALTMKIDSKQLSIDEDGTMMDYNKQISSQPITHQYRRYLNLPENEKKPQQKRERTRSGGNLSNLKPKLISQFRRNVSARQLVSLDQTCNSYQVPSFLTKNHNLSRMLNGEMRQVHSSPNLQKISNLELLHKVPYNCSTASINQATQQTNNSPRALSYMISIRHRLSNASSIFKYREESRAARIGIVVVAMFMLSYLPYGLLILLQGRVIYIQHASVYIILCLLIANISTPFIFAYRNRRVRRGVCRLFGVDTKPNGYLQKQRLQLRTSQTTNAATNASANANAKQVRIHRNLSASNFSINMLPYKFASHPMLPIKQHEQHKTIVSTNCTNGSVLVPINDVETESTNALSRENSQSEIRRIESPTTLNNDLNNNSADSNSMNPPKE